MKIHVRCKQVDVDEAVRAHIERRLQFSLGRLSRRILRVTTHIVDINGPRGGDDKVCRIEVRLPAASSIFVEAINANLYAAVDAAADCAARAVSRAIRRSRDIERYAKPNTAVPTSASLADDEQPAALGVNI